ncbi:sushi domain-containing protein 2 isoform X2 [Betta splendens]|uniref:Sushi domain-containing protein 2 isoform X2 n=1 Tax=Betta splendens TaxID=158456 RepID=A0A8M1HIV1_BETSP|nr:sushi domain-containing protein 2 isoform X2 [Betta splendens]
MRDTIFLSLLICCCKASGQTCRGACGDTLQECSCHVTCVSLLNCCADYRQFCLQVEPHSSSMLGGRALRILNLALNPGGRLVCRFNGETDREGFIDSEGRSHCVTPLLFETGWISLDVSVDNITFDRSGEYLSVHPSKVDPAFEVTLVNVTQWQYYGTPSVAGQLQMTWNSSLIGSERVNIELWGYRESFSSVEAQSNDSQAELSYLYSLGRNLPNTGSFGFIPEPSEVYSDWELGNIRITASSICDGARDVQCLWSGLHVLAWHLGQVFRANSSSWATTKCLQWDTLEKKLPEFLEELADCPCTLTQARADTGRFHADYSCDVERGSVCTYHPGSVHCVRAIQASPTLGSGQQCCYDSTGVLVLTGDSVGGSSPDRAHAWGSPPYRSPPRVPGFSHWLYDVTSLFYCCLWSENCDVYFSHRPSSGCRNYRPPRAGVVLGDPHFITFDGLSYTFNGKGEYHLVSSDRGLSVQARTEQMKLKNGALAKATQLSSVAVKEKDSDIIEVRVAEGQLQVLRGQRILPFSEQRWMDLHGVFVFSPTPQNVTVALLSGAGVEVRLREGTMAVTVLLPLEFTNDTWGLLGSMNSDPSDDLVTAQGQVFSSANATSQEVFIFASGWNVSAEVSLFTYDSKYLMDTYSLPPNHHPAFVPALSMPHVPDDDALVQNMVKMCVGEGAQVCKYDTLATRSLTMGNATLRAYEDHRALMDALAPVVSCGWMASPRNGKKNGTHYLAGDTLSFSCNKGYKRYGSAQRHCLDDGTWTGEEPNCLTDDHLEFVLGASGSLLTMIAMAVIIVRHSRKHSRERKVNPEEAVTPVRSGRS